MMFNPRWSMVGVFVVGAFSFGCTPKTAPLPPPGEIKEAPTAAPVEKATFTGILNESEFAALHKKTDVEAPAPVGEMVQLEGGPRAYLSRPQGASGPAAAVLVIHEWWGLNDHIKHWSDRLAADGYTALAVDLYGGQTADDAETAMALMKAVDPDTAKRTLTAALAYLRSEAGGRAPKVASVGWCFGGRWSLETAMLDPELAGAVVYYGHVPTEVEQLRSIKTEVLAFFGSQDASIPMAHVKAFDQALTDAAVKHAIQVYDAGHAFANPSQTSYAPEFAERAWTQTHEFLRRRLGGA